MTRKRRKTRTRQQVASMKRRALIGRWKYHLQWWLFSRSSRMRHNVVGVDWWPSLCRKVQEQFRCPVCHSKPMECPHSTIEVYHALQDQLVPAAKHKPWPFQYAGRWP